MNKYFRDLIANLKAQGWHVERHRHLKFFSPDGKTIVVCGCTESDHRALRNTMARLKRAGFHE